MGVTTNTDARASYSDFGSCVDFFAPGSNITSASFLTDTGTATMSGTSMAAPHVADVAALYLQGAPTSTPQQVRDGLFTLTTKNVVTDARSTNAHLLFGANHADSGTTPATTANDVSSASPRLASVALNRSSGFGR